VAEFQKAHREWVDDALRAGIGGRDGRWSEALAVGSQAYLDKIKAALGGRAFHRQITEAQGIYALREPAASYTPRFDGKNSALSPNNTHFWSDSLKATNA
jgi:putative transposase